MKNSPEDYDRWGTPTGMTYSIEDNEPKDTKEDVENSMLIPMIALALGTLLIGLFPRQAFEFVIKPTQVFVSCPEVPYIETTSLEINELESLINYTYGISAIFEFLILCLCFVIF